MDRWMTDSVILQYDQFDEGDETLRIDVRAECFRIVSTILVYRSNRICSEASRNLHMARAV